jgi:alpha-glucoside transport system permease protein
MNETVGDSSATPILTAEAPGRISASAAPRLSPARLAERLQGAVLHVAVIGLTVAWVVPAAGLFISSFRPFTAISSSGWWAALSPPFNFTLENYSKVLSSSNLGHSLFNSFMISIPATVIPVTIAAYAAYAFAWMRFPARDWIFLALVALLAVPLQLTFVPILKVFVAIGLTAQNWGFVPVWLAHTGYGLPFSIYLLANFFRALPSDLFESAEIDGAGTLTVFYRIVLPLSVPALASLVIFQFLWIWNDLLVALIYVGSTAEVAPLTVTLANLTNSLGQGYHLLTAAAFFSMIIPLIVFLTLQRYFVRGILAGSVKG